MTSRGSHLRPTHLTTLMGQVRSSVTPYNLEATFPRRPSLQTQAEPSSSAPGPPRYQTLGSVSGIILRRWDYRLMCRSPTLCGRCLRKGQCEPHPRECPAAIPQDGTLSLPNCWQTIITIQTFVVWLGLKCVKAIVFINVLQNDCT